MNNRLINRCLFLGAMLTIPLGFFSWDTITDAEVLAPVRADIDAVIQDEVIKQNIMGLAVGVVKNGKIIHLKGYGHTDENKKKKVSTSTIFRWASISKTITATAALQLEEKGKLNLEDKVTKHVSYWSSGGNKGKIKVKHVLSNRSGIKHYKAYTRASHTSSTFNSKQSVAVFKNGSLAFAPGSKYLYTSFGFGLAGAVVEEASPSGYIKWVENNIKKPMGMTSLRQGTGKGGGFTKKCDGIFKYVKEGNVAWKLPGGGWESNIGDLAKFANGLLQEKYLKKTDKLWTSIPNNENYCYGIKKNGSKVWHGGSHNDVSTLLYLYPSDDLGIVIMSNSKNIDVYRLTHHIANVFGKNWKDSHAPFDKCKTSKSCSGKFAGVWRKTNKDVIVRRGYTHDAFYTEWKSLKTAGYYCEDFEAYHQDGQLRWDGVFSKGSGGSAIWRNFDQDGFNAKWKEQSAKGYRLVDLETYTVNGKRKWAGLFRPGSGKYAMYRNQTKDGFAKKREANAKAGMKLIDIEVYTSGGKQKWSGVWVAGKDGLLNRNYSTDDFNALWKKRLKAGYKLVDIEAYKVGSATKWAGIWEKSSQGEYLNRGYNYCGIMEKHNSYSAKGYELIDLERY